MAWYKKDNIESDAKLCEINEISKFFRVKIKNNVYLCKKSQNIKETIIGDMIKIKDIELANISRFRGELMGAAMLFIILFHVALPRENAFFGLQRRHLCRSHALHRVQPLPRLALLPADEEDTQSEIS